MRTTRIKAGAALGLALVSMTIGACAADRGDDAIGEQEQALHATPVSGAGPGGAGGVTGLGGAGGAGGIGGAPGPTATLTIALPRLGEALYDSPKRVSPPWYDKKTKSITVSGRIDGLPRGLFLAANYQVLLNGRYAGTTSWNAGGYGVFTGVMPAPDDPSWVERGVMVELVNAARTDVVARDVVTYYDLRMTDEATPTAAPDLRIKGMGAQLTDYGVGNVPNVSKPTRLEIPGLSSLPQPDLGALVSDLTAAAVALPTVDDQTQKLGACMDLTDALKLEPKLTDLAAYKGVTGAFTQALVAYAAYQGYQTSAVTCDTLAGVFGPVSLGLSLFLTGACEATMNAWCVQAIPKTDDFEICFDRLGGDATSLSIASVSDLDLKYAATPSGETGARIDADVVVSGISGRVSGLLRGLQIRWKKGACILRPSADVDDADIPATDWLADFTTCHGIQVDAKSASTLVTKQPAGFSIGPSLADAERVDVTQVTDPHFSFVDATIASKKDLCAQDFLRAAADDLATGFQPLFQSVLNDVWSAGGRHTQQASAMEYLIGRLDLGKLAHADHEIEAIFDPMTSLPLSGAGVLWNTGVWPTAAGAVKRLTQGWFYHPAPHLPPVVLDAKDPLGAPTDFSFTLTTGFLNQILHARATNDVLWNDLAPTWNDLAPFGVTPSGTGHAAAGAPPLDGAVLGALAPMFAELGTRTIQIHVQPRLDPVAWMNPDPPLDLSDPITGSQLAYGIGAMKIRFAEPDTVDPTTGALVPGKEWLRLDFGFYDPNFAVGFAANPSDFLATTFVDEIWGASVITNAFSTCPKVPHGILEPPTSCERDLEATLTSLLTAQLRPAFLMLLAEIPGPQVWNAANRAPLSVQAKETTRFQMNQNITIYGSLGAHP